MWGDNIDTFGVREGEQLTAHIDIASREYNGRWYTDVKAWRVERGQEGDAGLADSGDPGPSAPPGAFDDDDVPF